MTLIDKLAAEVAANSNPSATALESNTKAMAFLTDVKAHNARVSRPLRIPLRRLREELATSFGLTVSEYALRRVYREIA